MARRITALIVACGFTIATSFAAHTAHAEPSTQPALPGVVIAHSPHSSGRWLGTPSIAILPDGTYVASHGEHGKAINVEKPIVSVYESKDRGVSWNEIGHVAPLQWATLYVHRGQLYLFGPLGEKRDLAIFHSSDGGHTWSAPTVIARGRYHTSSMPFVEHAGRLWRAVETFDKPDGQKHWEGDPFVPVMLSIPLDADLMDASAWTISDTARRPTNAEAGFAWGTWLEGNAVLAPDGSMKILMRCDYRHPGDGVEKAAIIDVSADGKHLSFNASTGFIDLPGGCKKFDVRFDDKTKTYFTLTNYVPERYFSGNPERTRNTVVLMASKDLRHWTARAAVLHHPDSATHGFQYADWRIDGDDLVATFRTAYDDGVGGAPSQHDANFLMFKRIANFRELTPDDSVTPWLADDLKARNAQADGPSTQPTRRAEVRESAKRVPGAIIYHSPSSSGIYIGSPGLCVLDDGTYLAKLDEFGPKSTENASAVTRVFKSSDKGNTWQPLARVDGCFWASLTQHRGALYLIGTSKQYGDLVVRKSVDGGKTWTTPSDAKHGLIRSGQWHTAPMPVIERDGRLWRAVEYAQGTGWGERFRPCAMSIPVDGDLLDADAWTVAEPMPRDGKWLGGDFKVMLEGNLVPAPDGRILNVLRTDQNQMAAIAVVSADGKSLSIDPALDRTPIDGTNKKFEIRYDAKAKCYWALCNPLPPGYDGNDPGGTRNVLALARSTDLKTWETRTILLAHPDFKKHAFQYVDWLIDGDDLILTSRTAYDDGVALPPRGHDANYLTFHRFPKFRAMTMADAVPVTMQKAE